MWEEDPRLQDESQEPVPGRGSLHSQRPGCDPGSPGPGSAWAAAGLGWWPLGLRKAASRLRPHLGVGFQRPPPRVCAWPPCSPCRQAESCHSFYRSGGGQRPALPHHPLTPLPSRFAWNQPVTLPLGQTVQLRCPAVMSCGLGSAGDSYLFGVSCSPRHAAWLGRAGLLCPTIQVVNRAGGDCSWGGPDLGTQGCPRAVPGLARVWPAVLGAGDQTCARLCVVCVSACLDLGVKGLWCWRQPKALPWEPGRGWTLP